MKSGELELADVILKGIIRTNSNSGKPVGLEKLLVEISQQYSVELISKSLTGVAMYWTWPFTPSR